MSGLNFGMAFGFQSKSNDGSTLYGNYGVFSDTNIQNFTINDITILTLDTTELSNGVTINGSEIKVVNAGVYNIQFSAQLNHTTGGLAVVSLWLRKNGDDVPYTCTDITIEGNNTKTVMAWNFVDLANADDYYELVVSATDDHCQIYSDGARINPIRPALPSLIVTVTQCNM